MKPYYEHAGITIYHGDCRDVLPQLPWSVLCTDPPYGNNTDYSLFDDTPANLAQLVNDMQHWFVKSVRTALTPGVGNMHLYPRPSWTLCWLTPAGAGRWALGILLLAADIGVGRRPILTKRARQAPRQHCNDRNSRRKRSPLPKTDRPMEVGSKTNITRSRRNHS